MCLGLLASPGGPCSARVFDATAVTTKGRTETAWATFSSTDRLTVSAVLAEVVFELVRAWIMQCAQARGSPGAKAMLCTTTVAGAKLLWSISWWIICEWSIAASLTILLQSDSVSLRCGHNAAIKSTPPWLKRSANPSNDVMASRFGIGFTLAWTRNDDEIIRDFNNGFVVANQA